jgi:hypothetical protein
MVYWQAILETQHVPHGCVPLHLTLRRLQASQALGGILKSVVGEREWGDKEDGEIPSNPPRRNMS